MPISPHITEKTRETTTTPDGAVIIAREHNALSPHPHPSQNRRLVPTAGLNKILVQPHDGSHPDGIELYECDTCGWVAPAPTNVVSHMTAHNPARFEPDYDIAVLRKIVRIAREERAHGVRGYASRAAKRLREQDITDTNGNPVTSDTVSRMFSRYANDPRIKITRSPRSGETEKPQPPTEKLGKHRLSHSPISGDVNITALSVKFGEAQAALARAFETFQQLAAIIEKLKPFVSEEQLTELREKAARYDTIKRTLG